MEFENSGANLNEKLMDDRAREAKVKKDLTNVVKALDADVKISEGSNSKQIRVMHRDIISQLLGYDADKAKGLEEEAKSKKDSILKKFEEFGKYASTGKWSKFDDAKLLYLDLNRELKSRDMIRDK